MTNREHFDAKWQAVTETGCWVWMGAIEGGGYGQYRWPGTPSRRTHAHRVSWMLRRGPIPEGMYLDHICRVRCCVNPSHLRVVTPRQNAIENSVGAAAKNAAKTHCPLGHPYTTENTYQYQYGTGGLRICKQCSRIHGEKKKGRHRVT